MIPLGQLGAELALGLGLALAGANVLALLRPRVPTRRRNGQAPPEPASTARSIVFIVIGALVALWGLAWLVRPR